MKNSTIATIAVLGVLGYFFYKSQNVSALSGSGDFWGGFGGGNNTVEAGNEVRSVDIQKAGVERLNSQASSGTLQRTSQTIAKGVTIGGTTGNIAKLGNGSTVFVSASPAVVDSSGKTNLDRLREKNIAGKTSEQLARKKSVK